MKKRILSALLCAALTLSLSPATFAAAGDVPLAEKALVLAELSIMNGDETGDLRLAAPLSRAELTKLVLAASPYRESVGASTATDPYPDVPHTHWAASWVQAAVSAGYVKGTLKGYFEPDRTITLAEGVTMALRLLGYAESDFSTGWPSGQMALYRSLKLDAGIAPADSAAPMTRSDACNLLYNLLTVSTKSGGTYLATLGHTLNQDGEVDLEALLELEREGPIAVSGNWKTLLPYDPASAIIYRENKRVPLGDLKEWDILYWSQAAAVLWAFPDSGNVMKELNAAVAGPVLAEGDWRSRLPFVPDGTTAVTRNGRTATLESLQSGDVVYWSNYQNALYAYSDTATGLVEGVAPSLASPTSITVAGTAYPLETSAAIFSCSDLGSVRKGDAVTLRFGRTGAVAAITAPLEGGENRVGVVTALGTAPYTDGQGKTYHQKTVTLTATDGQSYRYRWESDNVALGDLAKVSSTATGDAVSKLTAAALTGKWNANHTAIGGKPVAEDVQILDTYGDTAAKTVLPARLSGVTFSGTMVRYYEENAAGEVTRLVLNDVTGDLHQYGVLTAVSEFSLGMTLRGDYGYDLGGTPGRASSDGKLYPVKKGPFRLWTDGKLTNLTELKSVSVNGTSVAAGGKSHSLSERAVVYQLKDGDYFLSTLALVSGGGYTLSAYYDKPQKDGGLVRVLVARAV